LKGILKFLFPALLIFVMLDLIWNLNEFYHQPLQGDLIPLVLPDSLNAPVLKDPFGIKALKMETYHPNINRFFSAATLYAVFHSVPFCFQKLVDPIESLYLTSTLSKFLIYLGFLLLLIRVILGRKGKTRDWILAAFVLTPFLQVGGYFGNVELVGSSIVYHCFYAFPFFLLLAWMLPFFDAFRERKFEKLKPFHFILLIGLTIFCSLSSALMPGVVLIGGGIYFAFSFKNSMSYLRGLGEKPVSLAGLWNYQHLLLVLLIFLSIYSFYLGKFNSENVIDISLLDRYQKLGKGFINYYLSIPSLPIIWMTIGINFILLEKFNIHIWGRPFIRLLLPISLFILIYILLLPLGGYRIYRSLILRADMLLPTNILVLFLVSISSFTLLKQLKNRSLKIYSSFFFLIVVIFTFYDIGSFPSDKQCEANALYDVYNEKSNLVQLNEPCKVMDWEKIGNPKYYKNHALLWQYWNITNHEVLITMPNE